MLSSILSFHYGSDLVLPSLSAFLSPGCLETQTVLATIKLFVSAVMFVSVDVSNNLNTLFTLLTAAFNLLNSTF